MLELANKSQIEVILGFIKKIPSYLFSEKKTTDWLTCAFGNDDTEIYLSSDGGVFDGVITLELKKDVAFIAFCSGNGHGDEFLCKVNDYMKRKGVSKTVMCTTRKPEVFKKFGFKHKVSIMEKGL